MELGQINLENNQIYIRDYDQIGINDWWITAFETAKKVVVKIIENDSKVLDFGCGPSARSSRFLVDLGLDQVVATDFPHILNIAEKKCSDCDSIRFSQYPDIDNDFDLVFLAFVLLGKSAPDYRKMLSSVYQKLKPGGSIVALTTSQNLCNVSFTGNRLINITPEPIFSGCRSTNKVKDSNNQEYNFSGDRWYLDENQKLLFESVNYRNIELSYSERIDQVNQPFLVIKGTK